MSNTAASSHASISVWLPPVNGGDREDVNLQFWTHVRHCSILPLIRSDLMKSGNLKSSVDAEFDTIKSRCFHLVGSDGSISATFDARHDSTPVLTLFGDGLSRLVLTVDEGRPHISLKNPDGVSMVSISATQNGEFGLSLRRADNSEAASILVDINKEAAISVFDRNGKLVHRLSSDAP